VGSKHPDQFTEEFNRMKFTRNLFLLVITFALSACSFSLAEDITPPPGSEVVEPTQAEVETISQDVFPMLPPDPEQGAVIYAEKCAPCHGDTGMGDGPSSGTLSVPVAALGDPELARQSTLSGWFNMVTQGNIERFMPPFSSLDDRQRWDVAAYALTLSVSKETLAQGAELFQANCASCHGTDGSGNGPDAASLATAPGDFTSQERMAVKSEAQIAEAVRLGVGEAMPAYADQFGEAETWALAAYVRSLGFASAGEMAAAEAPESDAQAEASTEQDPTQAEAMDTGIITGTVQVSVLDAAGENLKMDLPVTLYAFDNMQYVYDTTLETQEDGVFTFEEVEMPSGRAFIASVVYNGVTYGSDVSSVVDASAPVALDITVYETTTDTSNLVIDRLHIFFDFSIPENVQVVELYIIQNTSDKTVVAETEGGAVVNFNLPADATNLQFEDGELGGRYLKTESGFADTRPVQAGSGDYQVVFAYNLPYGRKLKFTQEQGLSINSAVILAPEGVKVKGENLVDGGPRELQGTMYTMYTMQALSKGNLMSLDISGKPKSTDGSLSVDTRTSLLIGLGALGLALIVVGAWLFRRERMRPDYDEDDLDEGDEEEAEESEADPDQLMDAIIALDDMYKAGELPEEAYLQRRAALKTRLDNILHNPE
jgi:cbb3-type cytochrome c oxidase subunit III